jgi:hypothetical protein
MARGGFTNSDSVLSGSLASLTPPGGGAPKEQGDDVSADAISLKIAELKSPLSTESQCPFTDHSDGGGTDAAKGGRYGDSGIG